MTWFSLLFFVSGLCSIVYELVWLRLAMARFGVTSALIALVLSIFMAGLGAGSWIAGVMVQRYRERMPFSPIRLYALIELLIGISAVVVPAELAWGSHLLDTAAGSPSVSSGSYYILSSLWLVITLVPWCACMGATIPVGMFAIRTRWPDKSGRSFSLLYLANVVGAIAGACLTPALIELFGFRGTLRTGAILNALIFVSAMVAAAFQTSNGRGADSLTRSRFANEQSLGEDRKPASSAGFYGLTGSNSTLLLLFTTGFATMGAEVVWIRLYTFYMGPVVYSFAWILACYLAATFVGSKIYRIWSRHRCERDIRMLWISLSFFGVLPLLTADSRVSIQSHLRVLLGVAPFAGIIGFLTPMLVDRWSAGDPDRAGRAYAANVLGCILGPLVAGFALLPLFGERVSMLLLVLPWFAMALLPQPAKERGRRFAFNAAILIAAITVFFFTKDYEVRYADGEVRRDSTATVIAAGQGMQKELLVNGVGMTALTPVTKMMAHFTFTHLAQPPGNALIICFGMGTTFRSAMSWGIPVTVVELVPSVPGLFTYYHPDGGPLMASPLAHIVVDDGRRFLDRSAEQFDAVIIDPPPPIDAAGSSLLYSREFYELVRTHLKPDGVLQQWVFSGDSVDKAAATRALTQVFPYVRIYGPVDNTPGLHFIASEGPIVDRSALELRMRMPSRAVADMMEWGPAKTPEQQFDIMLKREIRPQHLIALSPETPALEDDRPLNEYDRLRRFFAKKVEVAGSQR